MYETPINRYQTLNLPMRLEKKMLSKQKKKEKVKS